jgi:hypothetical protein
VLRDRSPKEPMAWTFSAEEEENGAKKEEDKAAPDS